MATEEEQDEIIWRRRLKKRLAAVAFIKSTLEYTTCCSRPSTPDPLDRTVSKRRWEQAVMDFRRDLRIGEVNLGLEKESNFPAQPVADEGAYVIWFRMSL